VPNPNPLLRRLAFYAALAVGMFGALLALGGAVIATLAGHAPSPAVLAAVVVGVFLLFALVTRFMIGRIAWIGVITYLGRRIAAARDKRSSR